MLQNYENARKKKGEFSFDYEQNEPIDTIEQPDFSDISRNMQNAAASMEESRQHIDALGNTPQREEYYRSQMRNYLVPQDTEMRRRRQFVMSKNAVDDALDDYYQNDVYPEFEAQRKAAHDKGRKDYENHIRIPGANPHLALAEIQKTTDPKRVMDSTMDSLGDEKLNEISGAYARYAGLDPDAYRETVLKPNIYDRMVDKYVDESTPRNSAEYIFRGIADNSLTGKLGALGQKAYTGEYSGRFIDDAGMANYGANRMENFAVGVGSLMLDAGVFHGIGSAASTVTRGATSLVQKNLAGKILAKGAERGITTAGADAMAKRMITNSLKAKIAQSSATQGLTLGVYDAANSVADDILHNQSVDVGKAAGSFGKGFATGVALGAVGTPLREQARGLTGIKKGAASAGVLTAESAVFTAATEAEKLSMGVKVEPIDLLHDFGESVATLASMRMFNWRPLRGKSALNSVGRLKEDLRFTPAEKEEIADAGVEPESFISKLEKALNVSSKGLSVRGIDVRDDYLKLMSDPDLSASARSKLLYIVNGKVTSTPPVPVDYTLEELPDGKARATLYDITGGKIETMELENRSAIEGFLLMKAGALRRNRLATYEEILQRNYNTQDFFRQAGKYAKEKGVSVDVVSDAMYKKAQKEPLSNEENSMLDEILQRTGYAENDLGKMLLGMRRAVEEEYNLYPGTLATNLDKPTYRISKNINAAIDKYESLMLEQIDVLNGKRPRKNSFVHKLNEFDKTYADMSNSDILEMERNNYERGITDTQSAILEYDEVPDISEELGIKKGDNGLHPDVWKKRYKWNVYGYRNTPEKLQEFAEYANEVASELGLEVNFIKDERQIPYKGNPEYKNKLYARGWYDAVNKKITLNLPNILDNHELEKTIMHEAVGHYGFGRVFGVYYERFLEDVYRRATPAVKREIHKKASTYGNSSLHTLVDEYIADLTEYPPGDYEQRSLLRRFTGFVKNMLRKTDLYRYNSPISAGELKDLVDLHRQAMKNRRTPEWERQNIFQDFKDSRYDNDDYTNEEKYYDNEVRLYDNDPKMRYVAKPFRRQRKLHVDIHKEWQAMNGNSPANDNAPGGNSYRFMGVRGLENLEKRLGKKSAMRLNLEKAKKMYWEKQPATLIKEATGWEMGADGAWRMEIDDDVMLNDYIGMSLKASDDALYPAYKRIMNKSPQERTKLDNEMMEAIYEKATPVDDVAKLDYIVNDDYFFTFYPELRNVPVRFENMGDRLCEYDARSGVLYIDKHALHNPELEGELIVPMQQMVQQYEGFSRGRNAKEFALDGEMAEYEDASYIADMLAKHENDPDFDQRFMNIRRDFRANFGIPYTQFRRVFPTVNEYVNYLRTGKTRAVMGDVELRNVERRRSMPMSKRSFMSAAGTEDYPRNAQVRSMQGDYVKNYLQGPLDIIKERLFFLNEQDDVIGRTRGQMMNRNLPMNETMSSGLLNGGDRYLYRDNMRFLRERLSKSRENLDAILRMRRRKQN